MKLACLLSCVAGALALVTSAADNAQKKHQITGAERRAKRIAKIAAEGGLLTKPYSGRYVVIENAQSKIAEENLMPKQGGIEGLLQFPVKIVKSGEKFAKTAVHIVVADDNDAPTLLVAPEIPWAQVNVAALSADGPTDDVLLSRVQKEVWRAFLFCCGAANSEMQPCVMRTICSLSDLDAQKVRMPCPEPLNKVTNAGLALGLDNPTIRTYLQACEDGWAPLPTNDIQRTIWEKVHTPPTKPLKITYDKDKQKPVVK